jgi:hypothetical protein
VPRNMTSWAFPRTQVTGIVVKLQGRGGVPLPGHACLCVPRASPPPPMKQASRGARIWTAVGARPQSGREVESAGLGASKRVESRRLEELRVDSESRRLEREHKLLIEHRARTRASILTPSLTHSLTPALTLSLTHSITHSITPPSTHSLRHSLRHSLTQ